METMTEDKEQPKEMTCCATLDIVDANPTYSTNAEREPAVVC